METTIMGLGFRVLFSKSDYRQGLSFVGAQTMRIHSTKISDGDPDLEGP